MKAIIPVAGIGTRLRPHTHTIPKALVQVAGKPILGHILDELVPLGVEDVVLVTGYMGDRVRSYMEQAYADLNVCYVHQEERQGLGHAIFLTRECIGDEPVLIILGDTIVTADYSALLSDERTLIGVKEVEDPTRFGVVEVEDDMVQGLVEKPDVPPSNLAIVGLYNIAETGALFDGLAEIIDRGITTKGEYQLTDALRIMLEAGIEMGTFEVEGWYDCGLPDTLLETNRFLLERSGGNGSGVAGEDSVIIQPVSIDPTAVISRSIVGPFVSVAAGSRITDSVVRDSILNANAEVERSLLDRSLIGEGALVRGHYQRLNVGDSSEIVIGA
ncbi:MAG: NTP transferase domain-containing protein [Candidatus Eisenbacteria bacterium]|nr:NTP transferase domain-containing protein [Candidatus Eisenbacteria bacterium]